jgi:fumarate reductase subunit D
MAGKNSFLKSKIGKTVLVLLTAFLIFVGPTYMVHLMESVLKIPAIPSKLGGLFLFLMGVFLLWFLIRKRVIFEK